MSEGKVADTKTLPGDEGAGMGQGGVGQEEGEAGRGARGCERQWQWQVQVVGRVSAQQRVVAVLPFLRHRFLLVAAGNVVSEEGRE